MRLELPQAAPLRRSAFVVSLLVSVALTLAGCATEPQPERWHAPAFRLVGNWQWVSSLDVKTQQTLTPESEGFDAELHFMALSATSGTFTFRKDGAVAVQGEFSISYEDAPGNDFIVLDPGIDFVTRHAWVSAGPNNLYLGGVMELGYNSQFVRKSH